VHPVLFKKHLQLLRVYACSYASMFKIHSVDQILSKN